ncbi:calcineurin-like phosphoesterase C-terminal domain-containing protein [Algoriphagus zhangzhouensis]|uniref:Calcineurin-like phosphoesterase n=1 Tax=Algoriphagus zhangzhouensis TaxID=1073327 RepID=A0A1M7Z7Q0_9BACT|nr:calcineurin-like phosphoesterase C-terminal domain-containing protein [Algoriphagus zhangzhouensis]TDY49448.1 calcineurin-like phosphoesterase family protein [Algoriphagus zhangzhouensis]SHO60957.1 Calcineurin-like phosphoesterase [Algoriphagus zhangzhouensis]
MGLTPISNSIYNQVLAACMIGLLLFLTSMNPVQAQLQARGYVYEDLNKNRIQDPNEKGIPNVSVSNGVDVVQTDSKGFYELPISEDVMIFVIKPSHFQVPVNDLNQPQFHYIHKPKGSPQLLHPGVSPTGALPDWVNFGLFPNPEPNNFTALLFGDPQPDELEDVHSFEKAIVSELKGNSGALFGVSLGDLGKLDLWPAYNKAVAKVGIPWYNVFGNHDMNSDGGQDQLSDETFERTYGPPNYSFNLAEVHFIMLDDVIFPDPRGEGSYYGGLRPDILEFIKNDLQFVPKDKLVVLGFHIPLAQFEEPDPFRVEDRLALFDLLKDYPHTLSISGHTHSQNHHFYTEEEGWKGKGFHHHYNPGAVSGDVYKGPRDKYGTPAAFMRDGTPKGYAFLNIEGNTYSYEYKSSGESEDYKMSIHIPKIVPQAKKYRGEIVVNFFQGSPRDKVEFRVDDGEWLELKLTPKMDKYLLELEYEWDNAKQLPGGTRLSTPLISNHIWSKQMPSHYSLGEHVLEVRVTDWLGREYRAIESFEMVPDHGKYGF